MTKIEKNNIKLYLWVGYEDEWAEIYNDDYRVQSDCMYIPTNQTILDFAEADLQKLREEKEYFKTESFDEGIKYLEKRLEGIKQ